MVLNNAKIFDLTFKLWCKNNKIVINTNKTIALLICPKQHQTLNGGKLNIPINGHCLKKGMWLVKEFKVLESIVIYYGMDK